MNATRDGDNKHSDGDRIGLKYFFHHNILVERKWCQDLQPGCLGMCRKRNYMNDSNGKVYHVHTPYMHNIPEESVFDGGMG